MNNTTVNWTFVGALISFFAVNLAQMFSHFLTERREKLKYFKEVYQYLFSPIFLDIYSYLDIRTHHRQSHDIRNEIDEQEVRNKVIRHIGKNIKYANGKLIESFNAVKRFNYEENFSGIINEMNDLKLFLDFLEQLYFLVGKINIFDVESRKELIKYRILFLLWIKLAENHPNGVEHTSIILSFKFNEIAFTEQLYRRIKEEVNPIQRLMHVLKEITLEEKDYVKIRSILQERKEPIVNPFEDNHIQYLTIPKRKKYRFILLNELYLQHFKMGNKEIVIQMERDLFYKYKEKWLAYRYLYDKGYIHIEETNQLIDISITEKGIDFVEERLNSKED